MITSSSQSGQFWREAAKASWASAVVVFVMLSTGGAIASKVVLELVALALIALGLVSGLVALIGIPRHGARGILTPALIGMAVNGLIVFIFVTNFLAARARAQRLRPPQPSPLERVRKAAAFERGSWSGEYLGRVGSL